MPNRPTVYIVDDDSLVRESLALLVCSDGFRVAAFASAEEFLEGYSPNENAPACLVLDVRLEGMSGLGLQEELAARHIRLPVIIISGHSKTSQIVQAMRAGAVDFLEKPFDREALLTTIERSLDHDAQARCKHEDENQWSNRIELLSHREREVLQLLIAAKGTKQIAATLGIDPKTVSKHRAHILEKLQVERIVELARACGPLAHDRAVIAPQDSLTDTSDSQILRNWRRGNGPSSGSQHNPNTAQQQEHQ